MMLVAQLALRGLSSSMLTSCRPVFTVTSSLRLQQHKAVEKQDEHPVQERVQRSDEGAGGRPSGPSASSGVELPLDLDSSLFQPCLFPKLSSLPSHYMVLSKSRLSLLVTITSAAGYSIAPSSCWSLSTLSAALLGTALFSSSANTINQLLEVPFDSQMKRTRNRVLVRHILTTSHASLFAMLSALSGFFILHYGANNNAALLGLFTLVLYTCVYTPAKRLSIVNTWIGSVVGAVPPLIGYAAAAGSIDARAMILAGLLYTWQFPHFNSLSWNLRPDYSRAGYRMMSVTSPHLCCRVTLRHSFACLALCSIGAPTVGVTDWAFALESLPFNLVLCYLSFRFYNKPDSQSSRTLFRYTLIHLPLVLTLMFLCKKGCQSDERKGNLDLSSDHALSDCRVSGGFEIMGTHR